MYRTSTDPRCMLAMHSDLILSLIGVVIIASCVHSLSVKNIENKGAMNDYCQLETFQPACLKNEVVVIERAVYGRRRVGKCITEAEAAMSTDSRFIGCSVDVLGILNKKCSGMKQCEIRIPDADLEQTEPCLPGLKMYLEVSYSCVEVIEDDRSCVVPVTSTPVHVASPSANRQSTTRPDHGPHCGTQTQPWVLEAPAGQRINISLLDFTPIPRSDSEPSMQQLTHAAHNVARTGRCEQQRQQYGFIVDRSANKKNVSVCAASSSQRSSSVHVSSANVVELVMFLPGKQQVTNGQRNSFLLKLEAIGCTNLVPPEDAWIKREDDKIIIGCYTSRQTWQLRCQDGRWIGVVSNCTQYSFAQDAIFPSVVKKRVHMERYQVAILVAIGFVGLAFCLLIIFCGVVCLQRFRVITRSHKTEIPKDRDMLTLSPNMNNQPVNEDDRSVVMMFSPASNGRVQR